MFLLATTEVMLALLLAASTAYRDGMTALKAERYEVAIAQFSLVCELETPENVLRQAAVYFRGTAQMASGQRDAAMDDWLLLYQYPSNLRSNARHSHLWSQRAREAMLANGATAHELLTPEWAARTLFNALKQGKWDEALLYMSPELAKEWEAAKGPPDFALMQDLSPGGGPGSMVRVVAANRASGQFVDGAGSYQVELERRERLWVLTKCEAFHHSREPHKTIQANLEAMRTVGAALRAYVTANDGAWPTSLEAMVEADHSVAPELLLSHIPRSEETAPLLYTPPKPGQAAPRPTDPILAAPVAQNRHHLIYRADGQAAVLTAKDFDAWRKAYAEPPEVLREAAEDAKAKAKAAAAEARATAEKAAAEKAMAEAAAAHAAQVRAHMQAIATGDVVARVAARKALRAMGADAIPALQNYLKNEDPEVRETARELIRAATPAGTEAAPKPAKPAEQRPNGEPWIF